MLEKWQFKCAITPGPLDTSEEYFMFNGFISNGEEFRSSELLPGRRQSYTLNYVKADGTKVAVATQEGPAPAVWNDLAYSIVIIDSANYDADYFSGNLIQLPMSVDKNIIFHPIVNGEQDTNTNLYPKTKWENIDNAPTVLTDVQANGTSVVTDNVANIPIASYHKLGLVADGKNDGYGVAVRTDGVICTQMASNTQLANRAGNYTPVVPSNLDYAVKVALTDGKGAAYTDAEKAAAQARLGISGGGGNTVKNDYTNTELKVGASVTDPADGETVCTLKINNLVDDEASLDTSFFASSFAYGETTSSRLSPYQLVVTSSNEEDWWRSTSIGYSGIQIQGGNPPWGDTLPPNMSIGDNQIKSAYSSYGVSTSIVLCETDYDDEEGTEYPTSRIGIYANDGLYLNGRQISAVSPISYSVSGGSDLYALLIDGRRYQFKNVEPLTYQPSTGSTLQGLKINGTTYKLGGGGGGGSTVSVLTYTPTTNYTAYGLVVNGTTYKLGGGGSSSGAVQNNYSNSYLNFGHSYSSSTAGINVHAASGFNFTQSWPSVDESEDHRLSISLKYGDRQFISYDQIIGEDIVYGYLPKFSYSYESTPRAVQYGDYYQPRALYQQGDIVKMSSSSSDGGIYLCTSSTKDEYEEDEGETSYIWHYTWQRLSGVKTISSSSTDNEVPSAKCVYDLVGNVASALSALHNGT